MQAFSNLDPSNFSILKRLACSYIKPYKDKVFLAIFFMMLVAACTAAIVKIVEPAINEVFINHNRDMMFILPFMMIGLSTLKGVAEYFQSYLIKFLGQRILCDLQIVLYEHLLASDINFLHSQSSGRLISRFTNDIALMRGAVSTLLVGIAKHFLSVFFLIIVMFKLEPTLSALIFFVFPAAIYPIQKIGRKMKGLAYKAQEELGNYTAKLDETFHAIKIVKSYQAEGLESNRARYYIDNIFNLYRKSARFDALTSPIMEILSGIAVSGIIVYGGLLVIDGKTTTGSLFAFMTAFVSAYRPFKSLVSLNVNLQEGIAAAKRLFDVIDTPPMIRNNPQGQEVDCQKNPIILENVSLKFGNKYALKDLNLLINPRSTIALVGKSGEGKTSIANLLLRFYDPTNGSVKIGNIDMKDIKLSNLRSQIALVTQDTMLFDTSIAENIAYNMPGATMDEIMEAAKNAAAHDFIMNLADGYDTIIGAHGRNLSGGQRQRLAIARAFLKNAPILILDEATSSLDPSTEKEVQDAIDKLCFNRTTIIITHKIGNIKNVDMIYVVKDGKILESGKHDELLAIKGQYMQLINSQ